MPDEECDQCKAYECDIDDLSRERDQLQEELYKAHAETQDMENQRDDLQTEVDMLKAKLDSIRMEVGPNSCSSILLRTHASGLEAFKSVQSVQLRVSTRPCRRISE